MLFLLKQVQRSEGKLNICKPSKERVRTCKDYVIGREITTILKKAFDNVILELCDSCTLVTTLLVKKKKKKNQLSGSPAKSGPLDFGTKNNFPSFLVSEKGLVHIYKNAIYSFPVLYICFATSQN